MAQVSKFTKNEETVARILAASRGVDPDGPVIIQIPSSSPEMSTRQEEHAIAWKAYVSTARLILKALGRET